MISTFAESETRKKTFLSEDKCLVYYILISYKQQYISTNLS